MDIKPLDLPSAAGVEFGRGDVRHFSEDDAVNVPGLQNPTRQLAQRDNLITVKVNELVSTVNNKEQFVPLVLPKTVVPPGVEEIVTNFKIPDGFEARVLSAAIGSSPASSALFLKIYYAQGYGNLTGVELVSTQNTFNYGVQFYNDGEFIVTIRNNGTDTIEAAASVTVTIRPIGSQASLLVGSVIRGARGFPGGRGDLGGKGDPGVGGAGTPGLVWKRGWAAGVSYSPGDTVSHVTSGLTSTYTCTKANLSAMTTNEPPSSTYWDLVAAGSAGASGTGLNWRNAWNSVASYVPGDAVDDTVAGVTSSYICILTRASTSTHPGADASHWNVLAGPGNGETPTYQVADVSALLQATANIAGGSVSGIYLNYATGPAGFNANSFREFAVKNTAIETPHALVFLYGQIYVNLVASDVITVVLHTSLIQGSLWTTSEVALNVIPQGAIAGGNTIAIGQPSGSTYTITNLSSSDQKISVSLLGMKVIV